MNKLKLQKDPFESLFSGLSDYFNDFYYPHVKTNTWTGDSQYKLGSVNLSNTENEYLVDVSAPGFTKDELNIELKDGVLTISGEHKAESTDNDRTYTRREFSKKSFSRSFTVPENATDNIEASFENGILNILIKKKELPPKEEPKKISIK